MRIYCSMQFLESPRTRDQSDLKGSKKHQQPAPGLGKSRPLAGADGTPWTCYVFPTWKGVILEFILCRLCPSEDRTTDLITTTGSKTEINLRDLSHIGR